MNDELAVSKPAPWPARPPWHAELSSGAVLDTSGRALVMGIINVTPDSFSDGGRFAVPEVAISHARGLVQEGADILDVGGESTRPGSEPVAAEEEIDRVLPVIEALSDEVDVPISIDTQKIQVAEAALNAGAQMINDVSAMRTCPEIGALAAQRGAALCLMHMLGNPRTMQAAPTYGEVVSEVRAWLMERIEAALRVGVSEEKILIDPGFGFGKTPQHNLEILRRLDEFADAGVPVLIGTSRKSTIGKVLNAEHGERLYGTLATVACAVMSGCHVVRVHDVRPAREAVQMCEAIRRGVRWAQ